jgi:hypothetical protein
MTKLPVIYIAGAFRAPTPWDLAGNVRAARSAGLDVARAGAMPCVPHAIGEHFHGQLTDAFWLEGALELLRRCDAVYVFNPRHLETSAGTRDEEAEARRLGLPVFLDLADVAAWLAGKAAA